MEEEKNVFEDGSEGFTLLELFNIVKNNILLLMLFVIGFLTIGIVYTMYIVTPMYTSSIDLHIHILHEETSGTDSAKATTAKQVANNIKEYIKFPDIIQEVIDENNLSMSVGEIASHITTASRGDATAVKISFEHSDPLKAAFIVQKLAEKLAERINLDNSDSRSLKFATETVKALNYPKQDANQAPSSPNFMLNIIISLLLGGIVGIVIVILKEQFSTRYSTKSEIERILKLPVLALIPAKDEMGE